MEGNNIYIMLNGIQELCDKIFSNKTEVKSYKISLGHWNCSLKSVDISTSGDLKAMPGKHLLRKIQV